MKSYSKAHTLLYLTFFVWHALESVGFSFFSKILHVIDRYWNLPAQSWAMSFLKILYLTIFFCLFIPIASYIIILLSISMIFFFRFDLQTINRLNSPGNQLWSSYSSVKLLHIFQLPMEWIPKFLSCHPNLCTVWSNLTFPASLLKTPPRILYTLICP